MFEAIQLGRSSELGRAGAKVLRAGAGRLVMVTACSLIALSAGMQTAGAAPEDRNTETTLKQVDFGSETPSPKTRHFANWIFNSGDNKGLSFVVIDKQAAHAYVFRPDGTLKGAAPVLLGLAKGDDSVPGIGDRELSDMPPNVRTTPAGRFVAGLGENAHGKDVLWVDYDAAISMHRVINTKPQERRPHRLATPTPADNRISYGCINVPIKFFDDVIRPSFEGTNGIVYVMPEVHSMQQVFAGYQGIDPPAGPAVKTAERSETRPHARHPSVQRVATHLNAATRTN